MRGRGTECQRAQSAPLHSNPRLIAAHLHAAMNQACCVAGFLSGLLLAICICVYGGGFYSVTSLGPRAILPSAVLQKSETPQGVLAPKRDEETKLIGKKAEKGHPAEVIAFVEQAHSYCGRLGKNDKQQGTFDGSREKPMYPYLAETCLNRRQALSASVMLDAGCEAVIEVGAYLSPVASIQKQWNKTKYHIIVDPSAPTCAFKDDTAEGGAFVIEAGPLLNKTFHFYPF